MPEPGHADDGFSIRRVGTPEAKGIEVCAIEELSGEAAACTVFPEGTAAFAVAEKLLDILDATEPEEAALDKKSALSLELNQ